MFSLCVMKLSHCWALRLALLRSLVNSLLPPPGLVGPWGACIASFGILEGCLAVPVPGVSSTARCVLFLITFPVVERLRFLSRLSDCAEAHSFLGWLTLHSVFIHMTKRQERVDVVLCFL